MNTPEIEQALRERFAPPEYVTIFSVRNGTGYARKQERYADAITMGCYPSRGLHLIGFEIKASRTDWLKELKDPDKADGIARFCDLWYLVIGDSKIVQFGELPQAWGLIEPSKAGDKLIITKTPVQMQPAAVDRLFLASIMRSATQQSASATEIDMKVQAALKTAEEGHERKLKQYHGHLQERLAGLEKAIAEFGEKSGVDFRPWNAGNIGRAVKVILDSGLVSSHNGLSSLAATLKNMHEHALKAADELKLVIDENANE